MVAIKAVKLMTGKLTHEVVGLVSTAAQVSSMCERLANKLHIGKQSAIKVGNMGHTTTGYLPDQAVKVSCAITPGTKTKKCSGPDDVKVPVAFVITPLPFDELVLGYDWLDGMCKNFDGKFIVSSEMPSEMEEKDHIHVGYGSPTRGPGYQEGCQSLCHLLEVNKQDKAKLQELVKNTDIHE